MKGTRLNQPTKSDVAGGISGCIPLSVLSISLDWLNKIMSFKFCWIEDFIIYNFGEGIMSKFVAEHPQNPRTKPAPEFAPNRRPFVDFHMYTNQ
ncbi:unnamed protein product [Cuscuta epithymum]|uniref:Uncharacterized protein n=1 Tax=Cuscuta epithymum TaxID=186058 RepID=A0AAV0F8K9_9ASTE|nr:unnamed protein product [Cuscuta epithymum]